MRRLAAAFLAIGLALPTLASAQSEPDLVPARRVLVTEGVDFYGGDLRAIFDTSFEACQAACVADTQCRAFTFNQRAGSCFPKSDVTERQPFDGALSGQVVDTPAATLATASRRAAELAFLRPADLQAARRAAEEFSRYHYVGDYPVADYVRAASDARAAGNLRDAISFGAAAVLLTDAPDLWVAYADDMRAIEDSAQMRDKRGRALAAAINGYLRAADPATRAAALLAMGGALEDLGRGADSVPALRLAAELSPREDISAALDRAIAQFGFRVVETVVESDAASPRICADFSEPLVEAGVDYAPFVQIAGSGHSVDATGNRLCIEGVRHGERYEVTFRAGLPSATGETTTKPATVSLYVRDRAPSVRFPGRAYVLPKTEDAAIPVVTVNATSLDLILRRVSDRNILRAIQDDYFGRPLAQWQEDMFADGVSEEVWRGTGEVAGELNQDTTTRLPLDEAMRGLTPGIYALQARVTGEDVYETAAATQWFVISDLGLATMSGTDGLHVFVRSLGSAEPKAGVKLTLLSRANSVLGTVETDAEGYAVFPAGLTRGTGGSAPALVTAEEGMDDIAFLSLSDPEFDLSDRGVEGREAAPPIDLFLTTERGAYRAGDTIHLTALARDGAAEAIEGLPLTAILTRPDGVEYSRHLSDASQAGGHVFALPTSGSVPRGSWRIAVHADPDAAPLATTTVLVEDFVPERIDFTLALPDGPIAPTDAPVMTVEARYLFGTPAADLAVQGTVQLVAVRTLPDFPGYLFGRHDEPFSAAATYFGDGLRTDDAGRAVVPLTFPEVVLADRPLEARITAEVAEGSGRPVERRLSRLLSPAAALIGVKPAFDGVVPEGTEARFDVIAVGTDGARAAMPVRWTLNRVETTYQWYQLYGGWEWEPVTTRTRVTGGEGMLSPGAALSVAAPVEWGEYELRVERTDGMFAATSVSFYAGWYAPADASETPDTLSVALDKPAYLPGETATVRIVPRFAGKGLVTVVSNRLIAMQAVDLVEGENTVTFPVTDDWGAGAWAPAAEGPTPVGDYVRLGRGGLCRRDDHPPDGRGRGPQPGAGAGAGSCRGRSRPARAGCRVRGCVRGRAAGTDGGRSAGRGRRAGRNRLGDHRRRGPGHPEPDRLRKPGPAGPLLRPAEAGRRAARRLWAADRRDERRAGPGAVGRRRAGRQAVRGPAPDRGSGRPFLRPGRGGPGRAGAGEFRPAVLQRHRAADGGGMVQDRGRAGAGRRAGARPGRGDGHRAALHGAGGRVAASAGDRPCQRPDRAHGSWRHGRGGDPDGRRAGRSRAGAGRAAGGPRAPARG